MHSKRSKQTQSHNSPTIHPLTFEAIGTNWSIDVPPVEGNNLPGILEEIETRIRTFANDYSRFKKDSLVYRMYKKPGTYPLSSDAYPILRLSEELYKLSNGKFTPIIGSVLEDAGYDKDYSLMQKEIRDLPDFDKVVSYNKEKITLSDNVLLDFGACGKGYLIDIVSGILDKHAFPAYCIDASGDIFVKSKKSLRVGLEHPLNSKQVIGVAKIKNQSICASSGNRRQWQGFHHIIDPHTKSSPTNILATWAIADTAMIADALATALFLVEPQRLAPFSFEYLVLRSNFTLAKSAGFPAELYYN